MIERHWRGITSSENSDHYICHLTDETFPQLAAIPGFIKASIRQRNTVKGVEFLIITTWQSVDAIKKFAGEAFDTAVVPKRVQDIMVEFDEKAEHYELIMEVIS